jgi:hypothetical protein
MKLDDQAGMFLLVPGYNINKEIYYSYKTYIIQTFAIIKYNL